MLGTGDSNTVSALKLLTVKLRSRLVNRQIYLDVISANLGQMEEGQIRLLRGTSVETWGSRYCQRQSRAQ